ncbi:spondin domain-containing protein [Motilimonas pumila]|uniref:Spondin domain-containing protein n=1 Tax=Motilimonas pumila TaxID=2303987 RepID=A0A418YDL0_9GAMM|nr:spondin domain-containing protein [Motilimonas pumila]RJG42607.1 hypothetical protein D1Z90_12115 [Motilimonas pumila]
MKTYHPLIQPALALAFTGLLLGCGSDSSDTPTPVSISTTASYHISATNLTNSQPLSPFLVTLHQSGGLWQVGETASNALEILAEGGDSSALAANAEVMASVADGAPLMPGESSEQVLSYQGEAHLFSFVAMLVNTNDAFTGLTQLDLQSLAVGDSIDLQLPVYDAGTEANTERAGTIPGPADGGEGYNGSRDDKLDVVTMHPGVVSADDGLSQSVLLQQHKFANPVVTLTITRQE